MACSLFDLTGKVALVTGGSYGIGFAIASALAGAGAKIVFNDLTEELVEKGRAAYRQAGISAHGYVCDVTDEEAAQRTFTYIRASVAKGKDADGKSVDYDDDQKAEFETTMKGIADKAKTDFDGAKELDENLYSTTYSYGGDDSTMDEAVIAAADALKEGEVSDLITTEEYYYVIRLDSEFDQEATDKKKTDIASQRQADHYTEVCDGYKEASQFAVKEEAWAQVVFNRLFTAEADETEE